jgi:hypothetical protein
MWSAVTAPSSGRQGGGRVGGQPLATVQFPLGTPAASALRPITLPVGFGSTLAIGSNTGCVRGLAVDAESVPLPATSSQTHSATPARCVGETDPRGVSTC